jgi:hypothetical protein
MLDKEEYIEQAHLFRSLSERLSANEPIQELLAALKAEILVTTKLPMAIDYLLAELNHSGQMTSALQRLLHYFAPFQTFVIREAEYDWGRFDLVTAFAILHHEAELRARCIEPAALFFYQFESLCRNRLRYDDGLAAMSQDLYYDDTWKKWLARAHKRIESVGLADLVYVHSEYYLNRQAQLETQEQVENVILFGEREGKIALANRQKDPAYLFSALQRQLGYPQAPRRKTRDQAADLIPQLLRQVERIEVRLKLMEEEQRSGAIDLSKFMDPNKYKFPRTD